jgi:hypothetical protein
MNRDGFCPAFGSPKETCATRRSITSCGLNLVACDQSQASVRFLLSISSIYLINSSSATFHLSYTTNHSPQPLPTSTPSIIFYHHCLQQRRTRQDASTSARYPTHCRLLRTRSPPLQPRLVYGDFVPILHPVPGLHHVRILDLSPILNLDPIPKFCINRLRVSPAPWNLARPHASSNCRPGRRQTLATRSL